MTSVKERLAALRDAEADYERGLRHAYGEQRLAIYSKLHRIRRQIAMLTEADRTPMEAPEQKRRFA